MDTKNSGVLIVIEGGDGAGKATQTALLEEYFTQQGKNVTTFAFPEYEEPHSGKLLGELLKGDHGDFISINPYLASLPYSINRAAFKDKIVAALKDGGVVICDRYLPSNLAHQSAKLKTQEEKDEFVTFIEGLEYDALGLPRPTVVIYLGVPTGISMKLIDKKDSRHWLKGMLGKKDVAERDTKHQDAARKVYEHLVAQRPEWHLVECVQNDALRTREDIHDEVVSIVEKHLTQ